MLGCNLSALVSLAMEEPRLYELPLSDLCLVCEPPYTGGLRIAVVDEAGRHYMFCPEMEVTMYQSLFHTYAMYPGTVRELAYDGVLHRPPPYSPCGEFDAHYFMYSNVVNWEVEYVWRGYISRLRFRECGRVGVLDGN